MLVHILISALVAILIGLLFEAIVGVGATAALVTFIVLLIAGLLGHRLEVPGKRI